MAYLLKLIVRKDNEGGTLRTIKSGVDIDEDGEESEDGEAGDEESEGEERVEEEVKEEIVVGFIAATQIEDLGTGSPLKVPSINTSLISPRMDVALNSSTKTITLTFPSLCVSFSKFSIFFMCWPNSSAVSL